LKSVGWQVVRILLENHSISFFVISKKSFQVWITLLTFYLTSCYLSIREWRSRISFSYSYFTNYWWKNN